MTQNKKPNIKVLYDEQTLATEVERLAKEVTAKLPENVLVISILKGSFIFAADLLRAIHRAGGTPDVEFITLSSYGDRQTSSGKVQIMRDITNEVKGREILLVDDILESGRTMAFAKDLMYARGAKTVRTCVLLDKPHNRVVDITPDHKAFDCDDLFVIGYGMDMAHGYRQLPFIGVVVDDDEDDG
ncbi:MAG: hypoxanthine phosphoribosyltransferase [Rhizobiales bacterium]|nr:hypoxanthine phosphoribosyltransferase [Hyphomicrobiales bacterium]NRB15700.1 hypoxanthine phosphoribosyltransferase [Hyphomicrobiales bacterium]